MPFIYWMNVGVNVVTFVFLIGRTLFGLRRKDLTGIQTQLGGLSVKIAEQNGRVRSLETWKDGFVKEYEEFKDRGYATLERLEQTLKDLNEGQTSIREDIAALIERSGVSRRKNNRS
jgi:hypothetical protein